MYYLFNIVDAGLVGKELIIKFLMRVVELFVKCSTIMSLTPGVSVRM